MIYKPFGLRLKSRAERPLKNRLIRIGVFSGIYILCNVLIVPRIAKYFGRVNLPIISNKECRIKPANIFTVLGNRHYVKPELKELIVNTSRYINQKYPGTQLIYLDANFPFIDGFPLLPHLSHDDGEKLDINFLYQELKTGQRLNKSPSILGYGNVEEPKKGEYDQIIACKQQGYWQYDVLSRITIQRKRFKFDEQANKVLIDRLSRELEIGKIFIEPHLKKRLGLTSNDKVRYHGCHAVRHDDHIHIELR